jgi:hypothetical protein
LPPAGESFRINGGGTNMSSSSPDHAQTSHNHTAALVAALAAASAHVPRLVTSHQVRATMHWDHPIGRFNNWLAVKITKSVGTMWAAYLFALIGMVSFPQALAAFEKGDTVTGISWLSQSLLQLVLLPIIIVGQNVISASQDARAEADHETITVLHAINVHQLQLLEEERKILALMQKEREDRLRG